MNNPSIVVGAKSTTVVIVEVGQIDPPPVHYNSLVLCMPDGNKYRMTNQDAQVLGQRLNRAGGGDRL